MKAKGEVVAGVGTGKSATVADLDVMDEAAVALASYVEVDLDADVELQAKRCKEDADTGLKMTVRMGLRLMAIKAKVGHGGYLPWLEKIGISERTAQRSVQTAALFASAGSQRRQEMLLQMGQMKALAFMAAQPEVQQHIEEDPELLKDAFEGSKRELERRIAALTLQNERLQKAAETSTLQATTLASLDRVLVPGMPDEITDVRREVAALAEKARLAVHDLADLGNPLGEAGMVAGGELWIEPTALQVLIAMRSLHAQLSLQMDAWAERFALDAAAPLPGAADRAYYKPEEAAAVATHLETLRELHADQAERRANRAHNERSLGRKRQKV